MKPGIYQVSFRGLTLAEAWRFGKEPFKFFIALILKLLGYKGALYRLPAYEFERRCEEEELSEDAKDLLLDVVRDARNVGYTDGYFFTAKENLDPSIQEVFSYFALHQDRKRTIFIGYIKSEVSGMTTKNISIAGSLASDESDDIGFVDHVDYMDGLPTSKKIKVKGKGLDVVNAAMLDYMTIRDVRTFRDFSEMKTHSDEINEKAWELRIARGLVVLKDEIEPNRHMN